MNSKKQTKLPTGRHSAGKRGGKRVTSWAPGQSGNPEGRKPDLELRKVHELFRPHTQEAVRALVDIMKSGASERARVAAAEVVLDRGWGKAPSTLALTSPNDVPELASLADDELTKRMIEAAGVLSGQGKESNNS